MLKDLKVIDPLAIKNIDCPVFVQAADMRSFFGWGTRWRTKSNWNHSMVMRRQGYVVTQGWTFKEVAISDYMKPGSILKFWTCGDITMSERNTIMLKITHELSQPWHKKMYDVPGIVGQFFGIRWFNVPALNYCSERVVKLVKILFPDYKQKHPHPEDLDALYKASERMKVLGYWLQA